MYSSKESFGEMTNLDFCQGLKSYPFVETPEPMKGDVCPENDSYDNDCDSERDSQLKQAVEKVNETGDMIHIIKQELKCQILYKRFQEGKNAVDTEVKPPVQYEVIIKHFLFRQLSVINHLSLACFCRRTAAMLGHRLIRFLVEIIGRSIWLKTTQKHYHCRYKTQLFFSGRNTRLNKMADTKSQN
ncbi:uncharacterized protein LOC106877153 [Octopus bimaculoides]|uniref:uncharacterized protein LOC106877153 n=1 Tax=Octopus bimaculoides TaxID=37653 RepID=UPI00071E55C8|nr:uncharacterized protein LOC106877153 [Octopus bimaculoides]|eukprot:XP_014781449.1 PREDICTED: uncharacterized protein LOC106877153 [Octopus bimaculoides]